jgi:hypothetical protein
MDTARPGAWPAAAPPLLSLRIMPSDHFVRPATTLAVRRPFRGSLFSLGGVVAWYSRVDRSSVPWLISAVFLALLALSDVVVRGGRIDFVLAGLAAYELLIGLTEDPFAASPIRPSTSSVRLSSPDTAGLTVLSPCDRSVCGRA